MSNEWKRKIGEANRGKIRSEEYKINLSKRMTGVHRPHKGHPSFWKGKHLTPEARRKMSLARMGNKYSVGHSHPNPMKGKKFGPRPEWVREKISKSHIGVPLSAEHRKAMSGSNCHFWKGGVTAIHKMIRESVEYKHWRKAVFARDNYTCQECNERGGELHPHHIKPFADFPETRFDINNGVTLCKKCHEKTPTYGGNVLRLKKLNYALQGA